MSGSLPSFPLRPEGLVLEGGGLRGVYTSGALRALADLRLEFAGVFGTSMGACNGVDFVSRQWERNRVVNIRFVRDRRWYSPARLLLRGEIFGLDFIYGEIPLRIVPFDFETFFASPARFVAVAVDVDSGEAVYMDKRDLDGQALMTALKASTALPWIGKPVVFRGRRLMDGGLVDSIPLAKSEAEGFARNLVVLTQPAGYRKQPACLLGPMRLRHPGCPGLHQALARRHEQYNAALDRVADRERAGRAFVLRPSTTQGIGRVTRDHRLLTEFYDLGYAETLERGPELLAWLGAE